MRISDHLRENSEEQIVIGKLSPSGVLDEAICGHLSARHIQGVERSGLIAAHETFEKTRGEQASKACCYFNERLRAVLYAGNRISFLGGQALQLYQRLRSCSRLKLRVQNRMEASYKERNAIVRLVLAGDADADVGDFSLWLRSTPRPRPGRGDGKGPFREL